jgi:hypothetical protein
MTFSHRSLAVLSVIALLASSSIASCGVMFGAEEEDFCSEQSCSLPSQCPLTSCLCDDGVSRAVNSCITEQSCCAKASFTCKQLCAPYGGWSGQADAGSGGASGSAGVGGVGGTSGSAGTSGSGGASGFSGSSGSGGSGGTAGRGMLGLPCSGATRAVICGCLSPSDMVCGQVLRCSSPTASGVWEPGTVCESQARCFTNPARSFAGCGTPSFYLPYAIAGSPCLSGDTFACSLDRKTELFCSPSGFWLPQESCSGLCNAFPGGSPGCMSTTSFCVGCG